MRKEKEGRKRERANLVCHCPQRATTSNRAKWDGPLVIALGKRFPVAHFFRQSCRACGAAVFLGERGAAFPLSPVPSSWASNRHRCTGPNLGRSHPVRPIKALFAKLNYSWGGAGFSSISNMACNPRGARCAATGNYKKDWKWHIYTHLRGQLDSQRNSS